MSTVQPFRKALATLWASLPDAEVALTPRATATRARRIVIGQATGDTDRPTMGATRKVRETYDIPVVVSISANMTPDRTQTVADDVQALADAAELALRSSTGETLGVAGVEWAHVAGGFEWAEASADETGGPVNVTLQFSVQVRATYRLP